MNIRKTLTCVLALTAVIAFSTLPAEGMGNRKQTQEPAVEDGKTGGIGNNNQIQEPTVADGKKVKVHYTLKVEGAQIDTSAGRTPLEFEVGSKRFIPGFEKAIMGMKAGEKKSFSVAPDDAYGQENPEALREIPTDNLPPDVTPEPGMSLSATGPDGRIVQVRIAEVKDDVVVVNFNHPLAGKTLDFDVEVVEVN